MPVEMKQGSVFDSECYAIAHGVNVQGVMGAGIAYTVKTRFPQAFRVYRMLCREDRILKPGDFVAVAAEDLGADRTRTMRLVYNLATQQWAGPSASLEWIQKAANGMFEDLMERGLATVAMPRIGCGLGGLEWEDVARLFEHEQIRVEVWTP